MQVEYKIKQKLTEQGKTQSEINSALKEWDAFLAEFDNAVFEINETTIYDYDADELANHFLNGKTAAEVANLMTTELKRLDYVYRAIKSSNNDSEIKGQVLSVDYNKNELVICEFYTLEHGDKQITKTRERTDMVVTPSGRQVWAKAETYQDFGLVLRDHEGDFWRGGGRYTDDPRKAKVYHDTEAVHALCERMKRRRFMVADLEIGFVNYGDGWECLT